MALVCEMSNRHYKRKGKYKMTETNDQAGKTKEAKVIEVESGKDIPIPVQKELVTELNEKAVIVENLHKKIGVMVVQQGLLTDHVLTLRKELGEISLDAMKKAGIPEDKTEEYMVDISRGIIVPRNQHGSG